MNENNLVEREVKYVTIDGNEYEVVLEKEKGPITYLYLTNLADENDSFIRKYIDDKKEVLYPLDNNDEYTEAMKLIAE